MTLDGSPDHLTWDGLDKDESEEIKSEAENAPPSPDPERDPDPEGFAPPPPPPTNTFRESTLDPGRIEQIRLAALHALGRRKD